MQILFLAVFFALVLSLIAALGKFAVYLSRSGTLSWKHGYYFAGFLFTLSMTVKVFFHFLPVPEVVHPLLRSAGGLALSSAFAAFFFTHHAVKPDGSAIDWSGGAKAGAVWAGLFLLLMAPLALIMSELAR